MWLLGSVISISSDVGGPRHVVVGCNVCLVDRRLSAFFPGDVTSSSEMLFISEATALRHVMLCLFSMPAVAFSLRAPESMLGGFSVENQILSGAV